MKSHQHYKHIGIYAYRVDILSKIVTLAPTPLELAESLEQLRWIENGFRIKTAITDQETIGIDTKEDLEEALKLLEAGEIK
jgi:3-deoxy-manno-octulosonate cytidylyltransferase (CMP-KDO synthetase)